MRREGERLMHWQLIPYIFPALVSAVILAALAVAAWHRRPAPGAVLFCLLMLAMAEWSLGYALELASPALSSALLWHDIAWLGAIAAPTLWLAFTLLYTGRERWLARQNLALLIVEPLVTLLLIWTNGWHGLIESKVWLDSSVPFSSLVMTYGVWYQVNIAYSLLLLVLGAFILCSFILIYARSAHLYCVQGGCLFIAAAAPWVANVVTVPGSGPFFQLNLTSFAFLLSCLTFVLDLFLFRVLDIVPVARAITIERMRVAAIALDARNRVVYLNPAARQLVNYRASRTIGRPFAEIFANWPELLERCGTLVELEEEVSRSEGETVRYFGLHITPLYRRNSPLAVTGRLIVLYDLTERKQAEDSFRESEGRFRNIFAEVPIGMAVVDLEGRLLQVNKAFCQMLGYGQQELIGSHLSTITYADDVEKDTLLAAELLTGEITSYKAEKRYLKKNHELLWADLTATILRDQHGQAIYGLVMLENIIERKRAKLLEEERYHVAYELHDGLAQVVVSVHQHLQALASHYHPRSPQARQELERALELAQRSVREARRLIAGLRPTVLDDFGLATALRLQVEAQRTEGWSITYHETLGTVRLPPTIETTLFGVAQEALTNARKHAGTTRARLALERHGSTIRLEVQDLGCGFEPLAVLQEASLGEHIG